MGSRPRQEANYGMHSTYLQLRFAFSAFQYPRQVRDPIWMVLFCQFCCTRQVRVSGLSNVQNTGKVVLLCVVFKGVFDCVGGSFDVPRGLADKPWTLNLWRTRAAIVNDPFTRTYDY